MDKQRAETKAQSAGASKSPGLLRNYRKLAIPAVVAAVMPKRGAARSRDVPGDADGAPDVRTKRPSPRGS